MGSFLGELSATERLILINQFKIMSLLAVHDDQENTYYGNKRDFDNAVEILEQGYERNYDLITGQSLKAYLGNQIKPQVCDFVVDVLNMYRMLNSIEGTNSGEMPSLMTKFLGFDGNEEIDYYSYACFVVQKLGKYKEFADTDLNSHCLMVERYRKMVLAWKESVNVHSLGPEDYRRIKESISLE